MDMRAHALIILSSLGLAACGDKPISIAQKVKFKVSLGLKKVQLSFDINPEYQVKVAKNVSFQQLGNVFLTWSPAQQKNEMGCVLSGEPEILSGKWPSYIFKRFHNGKPLPDFIPEDGLNSWEKLDAKKTYVGILYHGGANFVAGGDLLGSDFNSLPKNFLAIQNFDFKNGDTRASIAVAGPTRYRPGGIYFMGNFGVDPFPSERMELSLKNVDREWEISASTPAEVVTWGSVWSSSLDGNVDDLFNNFGDHIAAFESPDLF